MRWYQHILPKKFSDRASAIPDLTHLVPDPEALPLDWEAKETIKDTYASGTEYFLFPGDLDPRRHELLTLLKAFSHFKKWQRSGMKFIMAGSTTRRTEELMEKLASYKYREDVIIIKDPAPHALLQLIAAAYSLVYLDTKDVFSVCLLNALQCKVPVITGNTPSIAKMMGDRGVLIQPDNYEELAAKLLLLYKDESFRSSLVNKA